MKNLRSRISIFFAALALACPTVHAAEESLAGAEGALRKAVTAARAKVGGLGGVACDGKILKNAPKSVFKCGADGEECRDCFVSQWESSTRITSMSANPDGACSKCTPLGNDGRPMAAVKDKARKI